MTVNSRITVALQVSEGVECMRISLQSDMKPTSQSHVVVPLGVDKFDLCVGVAAGALAEHQNNTHKDEHDPASCAKVALEITDDLLQELGRRKKVIVTV